MHPHTTQQIQYITDTYIFIYLIAMYQPKSTQHTGKRFKYFIANKFLCILIFLKRFICLVEVHNNPVNYTQTIKMFKLVKYEHSNCLSVINCIIIYIITKKFYILLLNIRIHLLMLQAQPL